MYINFALSEPGPFKVGFYEKTIEFSNIVSLLVIVGCGRPGINVPADLLSNNFDDIELEFGDEFLIPYYLTLTGNFKEFTISEYDDAEFVNGVYQPKGQAVESNYFKIDGRDMTCFLNHKGELDTLYIKYNRKGNIISYINKKYGYQCTNHYDGKDRIILMENKKLPDKSGLETIPNNFVDTLAEYSYSKDGLSGDAYSYSKEVNYFFVQMANYSRQ